jgi:hypothetical protein
LECDGNRGLPITEIACSLSMEKFYSSVAKMQKSCVTTPKLWASFRPQNRQEVQILAIFAVKSWEDQILGARRRCHRTTDKDHAIPVKQGFRPCFFFAFPPPLIQPPPLPHRRTMRQSRAPDAACDLQPHLTERFRSERDGYRSARALYRPRGPAALGWRFGTTFHIPWSRRNIVPKPRAAALTFMTGANRYRKSGMNCGMASMP